jgi:hypothetical protein
LRSISKDGSEMMEMEMMMERKDEVGQNKLLSIILHVVTMSEGSSTWWVPVFAP